MSKYYFTFQSIFFKPHKHVIPADDRYLKMANG